MKKIINLYRDEPLIAGITVGLVCGFLAEITGMWSFLPASWLASFLYITADFILVKR